MGCSSTLVVVCAMALLGLATIAQAKLVEHTFHVGNLTVRRLCKETTIIAVNGRLPGPTIHTREGDHVVVHVHNHSPYNMTIHWHGIFQLLSGWADGPGYVTQCPIPPGGSYTYRFRIIGQDGTLWWHAHVSFLRATVYGAFVIRPRTGPKGYRFPMPYKEIPIILGEWWNANVVDVENEALAVGGAPNISDAFTINGKPGELYPCSKKQTFKLNVTHGQRYMLRIVNAALNNQLFFKVAGHNLTVVSVDAGCTTPYNTNVIVMAPGQTLDALLVADAPPGRYYMAARPYSAVPNLRFDNTTTVAILRYVDEPTIPTTPPVLPILPPFNDTPTAHKFYTNLTGIIAPDVPKVPLRIDEHMFVTFGLGIVPCGKNATCVGPNGDALAASMNNVSFVFPTRLSLLEAHFGNVRGIYTRDFPSRPPVRFDYTSRNVSLDPVLMRTVKGTKLKRLRYNSTVEVVLQNTALLTTENHPIHLHGADFFVVAQGLGNYNATTARKMYNLVNPQVRNTIAVPDGGWAVIRFVANNPGVWLMHCHLDVHLPTGLAMAFEVENGPTPSTSLPPPPHDLPHC